jgi:SAM-dependent methyltransferase
MTDVWRRADGAFAREYDFLARTTAGERTASLLALLPDRRDRALDVGCGTGVLALHLSEHFRRVVGVDISPAMLAVAERSRAGQRRDSVDFVLADMRSLPLGLHAFDLVVSTAAIHHAPIGETLAALRQRVRPGGRLIVGAVVKSPVRLLDNRLADTVGLFRNLPAYLKVYGAGATCRLVRFRTSRGWRRIRFIGSRLTPDEFRDVCVRVLPSCTVVNTSRWGATAVWDTPR